MMPENARRTNQSAAGGGLETAMALGTTAQTPLAIGIPPQVIELLAQRAAEIVQERQPPEAAPEWLNTRDAAKHLACPPGRIHDLVQLGKLAPRRDGRRLVFRRQELDAYLESG